MLVADAVGAAVTCEGSTRLKDIFGSSEGLEVAEDNVRVIINVEVRAFAEVVIDPVDSAGEAEDAGNKSATYVNYTFGTYIDLA
ncbi:hypothetical protein Alg130_03972 [Pyrenophora tritici-repentis]|nr:hypothetical protein Alg130_03972 [Pyrenophora tritici-repentis]